MPSSQVKRKLLVRTIISLSQYISSISSQHCIVSLILIYSAKITNGEKSNCNDLSDFIATNLDYLICGGLHLYGNILFQVWTFSCIRTLYVSALRHLKLVDCMQIDQMHHQPIIIYQILQTCTTQNKNTTASMCITVKNRPITKYQGCLPSFPQ